MSIMNKIKLMNITANLGRCTRCEQLPSKVLGTGRLYLWFPLGHSVNKLISYLHSSDLKYQLFKQEQCLIIDLNHTKLTNIASELVTRFTTKELQDTRALFMTGSTQPQLGDFARITPLGEFIHFTQSGWLLDMLAEERFTSHFQPIVKAEDISSIFGQEVLLRGIEQDGSLIAPGRIFSMAREANLLFQLDRVARKTAIRETTRHKITDRIFINFVPTAIYDPAYCLRTTVSAIEQAGIPHEKVVFEVIESEQSQDINHLKNILRFYQDAGFLIALDDFGSGYSSLNLIHQLRPDFIKLDMELIRNVHQDPYKAIITQMILELAQNLEIKTIAEGIESEEELHWLRTHGADFVQGYLIAKPVAPQTEIAPLLLSHS